MFNSKKRLQELQEIKNAKKELEFIRDQLADASPKIDISNMCVFEKQRIKYLVKLFSEPYSENIFKSTAIDIFSGNVIYKKISKEPIYGVDFVDDGLCVPHFISCTPICEVIPELLAYPNKQVPEYVLQQAYYRLNNVNVNSKILSKAK